jgi:hypothetical protein
MPDRAKECNLVVHSIGLPAFSPRGTRCDKPKFNSSRISLVLLEMIQSECRSRNTHFSEFVRYAIVATMKRGRNQAIAE